MTPKSFDIATAKEWVGDARMRVIEARARADADADNYRPLHEVASTYAGQAAAAMADVVYHAAFDKRKHRNERKDNPRVVIDPELAAEIGRMTYGQISGPV